MIKKFTISLRKLLYKQGYLVQKTAPLSYEEPSVAKGEVDEVRKIISAFCKEEESRVSQAEILSYLTASRMGLTKALVTICSENNVALEDREIADVGCGMGYLFRCIEQNSDSSKLIGYDTYKEIFPLAKRLTKTAKFEVSSLYEIENKADVVFCMEVLEHLTEPSKGLSALWSLVRKGGHLVLSVPNGRLDIQDSGKIRDDRSAYWGHINFWSPESWSLFLQNRFPNLEVSTGNITPFHLFAVVHNPLS